MSEAVSPLSFVAVPIRPLMNSIAVSLVLVPLTDIAVTILAFPNAVPMFDPIDPLSIVLVTIHPGVDSLTVHFPVVVVSKVLVSIAELFITFTVTLVMVPRTFIDSSNLIYANSKTLALVVDYFTPVQ